MINLKAWAFRLGSWLFCTILLFASNPPLGPSPARADEAKWTFVSPRGPTGIAVPALMQVADFTESDPQIAGLMFRCNDGLIDTLVVLIDPLPPRASARISLRAGSSTQSFTASVIPTGAGLVAPFDPQALLASAWAGQKDLRVSVDANGSAFSALVHLNGLAPALSSLAFGCAARH